MYNLIEIFYETRFVRNGNLCYLIISISWVNTRGVYWLVSCFLCTPWNNWNKLNKKVINFGFLLEFFTKNLYLNVNFLISIKVSYIIFEELRHKWRSFISFFVEKMYKLYKNCIITKVAQFEKETFYSKLANQMCLKIIQRLFLNDFQLRKFHL